MVAHPRPFICRTNWSVRELIAAGFVVMAGLATVISAAAFRIIRMVRVFLAGDVFYVFAGIVDNFPALISPLAA